jgi:hypothetical protein
MWWDMIDATDDRLWSHGHYRQRGVEVGIDLYIRELHLWRFWIGLIST